MPKHILNWIFRFKHTNTTFLLKNFSACVRANVSWIFQREIRKIQRMCHSRYLLFIKRTNHTNIYKTEAHRKLQASSIRRAKKHFCKWFCCIWTWFSVVKSGFRDLQEESWWCESDWSFVWYLGVSENSIVTFFSKKNWKPKKHFNLAWKSVKFFHRHTNWIFLMFRWVFPSNTRESGWKVPTEAQWIENVSLSSVFVGVLSVFLTVLDYLHCFRRQNRVWRATQNRKLLKKKFKIRKIVCIWEHRQGMS